MSDCHINTDIHGVYMLMQYTVIGPPLKRQFSDEKLLIIIFSLFKR